MLELLRDYPWALGMGALRTIPDASLREHRRALEADNVTSEAGKQKKDLNLKSLVTKTHNGLQKVFQLEIQPLT